MITWYTEGFRDAGMRALEKGSTTGDDEAQIYCAF